MAFSVNCPLPGSLESSSYSPRSMEVMWVMEVMEEIRYESLMATAAALNDHCSLLGRVRSMAI